MKVHPHTWWGGCGGGSTTAKILISDGVSFCHTKAILYPTGKTAVWNSTDLLKDCAEKKFDPTISEIHYTIQPTDIYMYYCIEEVAVIFDDQQSTKYMKDTNDKWRKGSQEFDLTKPKAVDEES